MCFDIITTTIIAHQSLGVERANLHRALGHFSLFAQISCKQANPINQPSESYLVTECTKRPVINEYVAGIVHEEALIFLFRNILSVAQQLQDSPFLPWKGYFFRVRSPVMEQGPPCSQLPYIRWGKCSWLRILNLCLCVLDNLQFPISAS